MKTVFAAISIIAFLYGILVMLNARSAIHEIEVFLLFIISLIAAGFSSIHGMRNIVITNNNPKEEKKNER